MGIPFEPRAIFYTCLVMTAVAGLAAVDRPTWLGGSGGGRGTLPLGAGGSPARDERREIILEVLRHEAQFADQAGSCVRLDAHGAAFDRERAEIADLQANLADDPERRQIDIQRLYRLRNPRTDWLLPPRRSPDGRPEPRLDAPLSARLSVAQGALIAAPPPEAGRYVLAESDLPNGLRAPASGCGTMSFSLPATIGDVAFVEIKRASGSNAGRERLYALANRDDRWSLYALASR